MTVVHDSCSVSRNKKGFDMFFYSDTNSSSFNPAIAARINPTTAIKNHLDNYFLLKLVLLRSDSIIERAQASKELDICERKIAYHERNPKLDVQAVDAHRDYLKKIYAM